MKKNRLFRALATLLSLSVALSLCGGCRKYLDAKSDQSIATPSTIGDLEGILDNFAFMNSRSPVIPEVSADNYYLKPADWAAVAEAQRNYYTWQKYDQIGGEYFSSYSTIEHANIILDVLPRISPASTVRMNRVRGEALFIRASNHFALAQFFCKVYNPATAEKDAGIALRLTSDIAERSNRSTVAETYAQILEDLKTAAPLLPPMPDVRYRGSRCAIYGQLSRVYLSMSDFRQAGLYADSALKIYDRLIDYNMVSQTATIPFAQFNEEVIYDTRSSAAQALAQTRARVDTTLFASYATNDLRRTVFYRANTDGSRGFKGNYTGQNTAAMFTGISTDELYLTKAEAAQRTGRYEEALAALNALLLKRWKAGTFIPVTMTTPQELLSVILSERRKELVFRNLRWTDLRRLNLEAGLRKVLKRDLGGTVYTLEPGSDRYTIQLDRNAIELGRLQQNP